jgi:hypothetical protein
MQMKAILKDLRWEFSFFECRKKLNDSHSLNFTGFYPNSRGKNSPNSAEVTELTSETYNSYWGYQDGKKRNARVKLSKNQS